MRKTLMVSFMLLLSAAWLQAQDAGKANSKASGPETIEGCLSMSEGQYNLVDDTETVHHLTGGAAKLKGLVGHQVEVTGKTGVRTVDTTLAGAGSSAVTQWVFEVKSAKQTAETCK